MKLSVESLCALRGYLQGLSAEESISAFLPDLREPPGRWLKTRLEELRLKAKRLGREDLAEALADRPYTDQAIRRAIRALEEIAGAQDPTPEPHHRLALWLPGRMLARCRQAGLETVDDLRRNLHRLPRPWARRLGDWLAGIGLLPPATSPPATPPRPSGLGARSRDDVLPPVLQLNIPEPLSGRNGRNRLPKPAIQAEDDLAAVCVWLARWPRDSHTYRTYRKETERLLLWCLTVHGKALSDLTPEDVLLYLNFLRQPPANWIGPPTPRHHPNFRPLRGPLSSRSIRQAEQILRGLFQFLVEQRYLAANPFSALPKRRPPVPTGRRWFSQEEWQMVLGHVRARAQSGALPDLRARFAVELAYLTGLRISEMSLARTGDIELVQSGGTPQHWLNVHGKGGKPRRVPLPAILVELLCEYLVRRGLGRNPTRAFTALPPETPLLACLRPRLVPDGSGWKAVETPMSPATLHRLFKQVFAEVAERLSPHQAASCHPPRLQLAVAMTLFLKASAHWLRHTHASHALKVGASITSVRDNLGHASLHTTSRYLHQEEEKRFQEMAALALENAESTNTAADGG